MAQVLRLPGVVLPKALVAACLARAQAARDAPEHQTRLHALAELAKVGLSALACDGRRLTMSIKILDVTAAGLFAGAAAVCPVDPPPSSS